ncbi:MAG: HAMP domain-containing histidine kinase [Clostridiales bacterium]|nr:HAMP domain-containing histidine kinase [Clostridiales bacterium]
MVDKEENIDIMYVKLTHIFGTIIFAILSFILLIIANKLLNGIGDAIISLIYIIASVIILIILKNTVRIYKSKYLLLVIVIYSIISLQSLSWFLPLEPNNLLYNMRFSTCILAAFYSALFSLIWNNYIREINNKKNNITIYLISIFITIVATLYLNYIRKEDYIAIFCCLIVSIINYFNYTNLADYPFLREKEINYFKFSIISLYIIIAINILAVILVDKNIKWDSINRISLYICFLVNCVATISKMINSPYKIIFDKYYEKNEEMNRLNKEIIHQNKELDFSQKYLKSKDLTMKSFFKNVPIPIVIIDDNSKRIKYANNSFLEILETENIKSIINKKLTKLLNIDEEEFNVINNEMIRGELKLEYNTKYLNLEVLESLDSEDESLILFTDITEQVNKYKMQELLDNKVFEEKLKRNFLSNISHDLKTPINVIYSAAQVSDLFIKENNYEALAKYNEIANKSCNSLIKFTNNIIDESKIKSEFLSANLFKENISQVVEEIILGLVDYAETRNITLSFETESYDFYAEIDVDFIQRIIINLVSNSIKFTSSGGKIKVSLKEINEEILLTIEDNGIGMDEESLYNAFEKYSMGNNNELINEKGSGIGLFIVSRLVEKQKARMKVHSKVNEGTRTEIFFKKVI